MNPMSELLDEHAAADFLTVSVRSLQAWRVSGRGPVFIKVGARVRYRRADLSDWIAANARRSTADTGEAAR